MTLKSRSTTLKISSKPLILRRQNETWQEIRAVKLLPSVTARILADIHCTVLPVQSRTGRVKDPNPPKSCFPIHTVV